jgi:hypothetical protein
MSNKLNGLSVTACHVLLDALTLYVEANKDTWTTVERDEVAYLAEQLQAIAGRLEGFK